MKSSIRRRFRWRDNTGLDLFTQGRRGILAFITVRRFAEQEPRSVSLLRSSQNPLLADGYRHDTVERIQEGVYYLDMNVLTEDELQQWMPTLAKAKGIIVDIRRYPRTSALTVLRHCTEVPLQSPQWHIPQMLYPAKNGLLDTIHQAGGYFRQQNLGYKEK